MTNPDPGRTPDETSAQLQRLWDETGRLDLDGLFTLGSPLFLGPHASGGPGAGYVRGPHRLRTHLHTGASGSGLVVGLRRGMVEPECWVAGGFRTLGRHSVVCFGTAASGPRRPGRGVGWEDESFLSVRFRGTRHGGRWPQDFPQHVEPTGLCGVTTLTQFPRVFHHDPHPWHLYWEHDGTLRLAVTTADRAVRVFVIVADQYEPELDVTVDLDLAAGTCTASVNGGAAAVSLDLAGADFSAGGLTLAACDEGAFRVGALGPGWAPGYWGSAVADMTVRAADVSLRSGEVFSLLVDGAVLPQEVETYPGGPALPLVRVWDAWGGRYGYVASAGQGVPDSAGDIEIAGLTVSGNPGGSAVDVGGVHGDLLLAGSVFGGWRGVNALGVAVAYRVSSVGNRYDNNPDCGVYLERSIFLSDRDSFRYQGRRVACLRGCYGEVRGPVLIAPDGGEAPTMEYVFGQAGGEVAYSGLLHDDEWPAGVRHARAFLALRPDTLGPPEWPTRAWIDRCHPGPFVPLLAVDARPGTGGDYPGYRGDVEVSAGGAVVYRDATGAA